MSDKEDEFLDSVLDSIVFQQPKTQTSEENLESIQQPIDQPVNIVDLIIQCPHCQGEIFVDQINCGIFRHGVFKHNLEQIPPHSPQDLCEQLVENDLIFGCGKPFQIKYEQGSFHISICDYI